MCNKLYSSVVILSSMHSHSGHSSLSVLNPNGQNKLQAGLAGHLLARKTKPINSQLSHQSSVIVYIIMKRRDVIVTHLLVRLAGIEGDTRTSHNHLHHVSAQADNR